MDTHDMTMDGRAGRAAYPTIPQTTAETVAKRLFRHDGNGRDPARRDLTATRSSTSAPYSWRDRVPISGVPRDSSCTRLRASPRVVACVRNRPYVLATPDSIRTCG
jgi:hypothetical protein